MKRGFTLIEMLITISVIAILMGASITGITTMTKKASLDNAVRQLESDLYLAKQKAMSNGSSCRLTCGTDRYVVEVLDIISDHYSLIKNTALGQSLAFKNRCTFTFSSNGFPVPGYFGTATVQSADGRDKKVVVSSVGRIRIE
ncbi:MAG: GspH/FimT family protein [Candidatus Saganbacteria bacterium]|nr:GspH/FimT family protein [Candidatus Saganbacteria bacterium]